MTPKFYRNLRSLLSLAAHFSVFSNGTRLKLFPAILISITVSLLLLLIRQLGGLQELEMATFDRGIRLMGDRGPDPRLLVVSITEEDIQALGRVPLSDRRIAQALAQLQRQQPKVIGLDIYRDVPQEPGHKELLTQLKAPNTIAISKFNDSESMGVPPPPGVPPDRIGFNDLVLDLDGVVRRNLVFLSKSGGKPLYSFSFRLAFFYLKDIVEPKK